MTPLLLALLSLAPPFFWNLQGGTGRERILGKVRGADGKPWAEAEVRLFSPWSPGASPARIGDSLVVKTDLAGRFRAPVLPARIYQAWAWKQGPGRTWRATGIRQGLRAGSVVVLQEGSATDYAPLPLPEIDPGPWRDEGPFHWETVLGRRVLVLPEEAESLAPYPPPPLRMRFVAKNGLPLLDRELDPREPNEVAGLGSPLPPTAEFRIRAVSKPGGKAPVNARIRLWALDRWIPLGTTGVREPLLVRIPIFDGREKASSTPYTRLPFLAQAKGLADMTYIYVASARKKKGGPPLPEGVALRAPLTIHMQKGFAVRGRLLAREGRPLPGAALLLQGPYPPNGRAFPPPRGEDPRFLRTDADGGFEAKGLAPRVGTRISLLLEPRILEALGLPPGKPWAGLVPLHLIYKKEAADEDLGDISLDSLAQVAVRILNADGSPARGARVVLREKITRGLGNWLTSFPILDFFADRRGSLRFLGPKEGRFHLAGTRDGAYCIVDLPKLGEIEGLLTLNLQPAVFLEGRVEDLRKKPVPEAKITLNPFRVYGKPENLLIRSIWKNTWTADEAGRFRIPLPFLEESYYLWARVKVGGRWFGTTGQRILEVERRNPEKETIVIDVPPRKTKKHTKPGERK